MSNKRLSLAQQIALVEDATPNDIDPEDLFIRENGDDGLPEVESGSRDHYFEVGPSTLRPIHDSLSDPKYEGTKVSRKQLMEQEYAQSEEDENEESGSSDEDGSEFDDELGGAFNPQSSHTEEEGEEEEEDDDGGAENEAEDDDGEEEEEEASKKNAPPPTAPAEDLSSALRRNRNEDYEKGKAVSRQLSLWDSLLDARIRLQKSTIASNKLPRTLDLKEYTSIPECQEAMQHMLAEASALSEDISRLQEHLLSSNESIEPPPRKRRRLDEDRSLDDYSTWIQEAAEDSSSLEASFHPHLVRTLNKWSAKVQAVSPAVLLPSNRGAFASKGAQKTKSVLQVIDEVLADHDKLVARTKVNRSEVKRLGQTEDAEDEANVDLEIFDDADFYQQILRDVIESRGGGSHGEDWMAAQKQKKAKKKVDTKASKGRKLRYEPHEKLQNFMMPVPTIGGWHEEQIDELFASLLGRGFESKPDIAEHGYEEESRRILDDQVTESLNKGFRLFG